MQRLITTSRDELSTGKNHGRCLTGRRIQIARLVSTCQLKLKVHAFKRLCPPMKLESSSALDTAFLWSADTLPEPPAVGKKQGSYLWSGHVHRHKFIHQSFSPYSSTGRRLPSGVKGTGTEHWVSWKADWDDNVIWRYSVLGHVQTTLFVVSDYVWTVLVSVSRSTLQMFHQDTILRTAPPSHSSPYTGTAWM